MMPRKVLLVFGVLAVCIATQATESLPGDHRKRACGRHRGDEMSAGRSNPGQASHATYAQGGAHVSSTGWAISLANCCGTVASGGTVHSNQNTCMHGFSRNNREYGASVDKSLRQGCIQTQPLRLAMEMVVCI